MAYQRFESESDYLCDFPWNVTADSNNSGHFAFQACPIVNEMIIVNEYVVPFHPFLLPQDDPG